MPGYLSWRRPWRTASRHAIARLWLRVRASSRWTIRFTHGTARAIDRHQRERDRHRMARVGALWLGVRGGP
jgi:hypothetical protein